MDAIYDVAEAMDGQYLQRLLSDLECHELISLPIRLVVDSILQINFENQTKEKKRKIFNYFYSLPIIDML